MSKAAKVVVLVGLFVLIGVTVSSFAKPGAERSTSKTSITLAEGEEADLPLVGKVIDGDTFDLIVDGKKETVRLIGVDAPEAVNSRKPVQCFAKEASAYVKTRLEGKRVRLEADLTQGERDKYQRLLRYVFLEDGTNFNLELISKGYAHEYTYNVPYKYQAEFKQAQLEAQNNKSGLWADGACPTPGLGAKGSKAQ